MAEPLYELTKKTASWNWSDECDVAFCCLINKLIREPVLSSSRIWDNNFVVEAGASISAVAVVLSLKEMIDWTSAPYRVLFVFINITLLASWKRGQSSRRAGSGAYT